MKFTDCQTRLAGRPRRISVDRRQFDAFRTPLWHARPARCAVPWFGLAAAMGLHAFAVAALAFWQQPFPAETPEVYEVTIDPGCFSIEALPLPPGPHGADEPDDRGMDSTAAAESPATLSNYWDAVRAAIAGRVRYPQAAIRQGIEGTIDLRLTLDGQGALLEVVPLESTPEILVQSAMSAAHRAAPFPRNTSGTSHVASAVLPVHFQLNGNPERSPPK